MWTVIGRWTEKSLPIVYNKDLPDGIRHESISVLWSYCVAWHGIRASSFLALMSLVTPLSALHIPALLLQSCSWHCLRPLSVIFYIFRPDMVGRSERWTVNKRFLPYLFIESISSAIIVSPCSLFEERWCSDCRAGATEVLKCESKSIEFAQTRF